MDIKFIKTADGACFVDVTATVGTEPTGRYNLPMGAGYNCDVAANKHTIMAPNLPGGKLKFLTSEIDTGGSDPVLVGSGSAALYTEINNGFFRKASGGGALNSSAMSSTIWSGVNSKTLSANLDVTIGTATTGIMLLNNTGSYTFKVYGTSIVIRNSGTNGGRTIVSYILHTNGKLWVESDADNLPIEVTIPAPDTTAPTLVSITVENAAPSDVVLTYDETLANIVPATGDIVIKVNTVPVTVSSVAVSTTKATATLSAPIANGDTVTASYTPGTNKIQDAAGNLAVSLTNHAVTNNVAAGSSNQLVNFSPTGTLTEVAPNDWQAGSTSGTFANWGRADKHLPLGTDGFIQMEYPAAGAAAVLGLSGSNSTSQTAFTIDVCVGFYGDIITMVGGTVTHSGVSPSSGDIVRFEVVAGVLYSRYSTNGGTSFTDLINYGAVTVDLYFFGFSDPSGHIYHPQSSGLV